MPHSHLNPSTAGPLGQLHLAKSFCHDGFSFSRIEPTGEDFDAFCDFFARQILEHHQQGTTDKGFAEVKQGVADGERALGAAGVVIACKKEGEIVGCVRVAIDTPEHPIPFEGSLGMSLDALRDQGRMMEISRLAVAPAHRTRPLVLEGLLAWCNNVALACKVDFVFAVAFPYVLPLYQRLAYELIFPKDHAKHAVKMPNGFLMHPIGLNLSGALVHRRDEFDQKTKRLTFLDRGLQAEACARLERRHAIQPVAPGMKPILEALVPQAHPERSQTRSMRM